MKLNQAILSTLALKKLIQSTCLFLLTVITVNAQNKSQVASGISANSTGQIQTSVVEFNAERIENATRQSLTANFEHYSLYKIDSDLMSNYTQSTRGRDIVFNLSLPNVGLFEIELQHHNILSSDYRLIVADESGERVSTNRGNITFKGVLSGKEKSTVVLTIANGLIYGIINTGKKEYFIEPLRNITNQRAYNVFVVYETEDVVYNPENTCGVTESHRLVKSTKSNHLQKSVGDCFQVRLALASDEAAVTWAGGTVLEMEQYNIALINTIAPYFLDFEFPTSVELVIAGQYISTSLATDPYGVAGGACACDIFAQLEAFRIWTANDGFSGLEYDLAHNITNHFPPPGTIGLAYVGELAANDSYNIGVSTLSSETWLTVIHELGHNFGMDHSFEYGQGSTGGFMDYGDGRWNGEYSWGPPELTHSEFENEVNSVSSVLSNCSVGVYDFYAPDVVCLGTPVQFNTYSYGGPYLWTFSEGSPSSSTDEDPIVNFGTLGQKTITLTIDEGTTFTKNLIVSNGIESTTCIPLTPSGSLNNAGSTYFGLGAISKDSRTTQDEGHYLDYSCSDNTILDMGTLYKVEAIAAFGSGGQVTRQLFIDYNNDGDFEDSDEMIYNGLVGSFSFTTPASGVVEDKLLRARLIVKLFDTTVDACWTPDDNGNQTEDYGVYFVSPCVANEWVGATSTDWNDASNWCTGVVPGITDDVKISINNNQPHIATAAPGVLCNNLTVVSGATLTVDPAKALTINGNLSNEGSLLIKADATGIGSLITNGIVSGAGAFQMEQYLTGAGGATPNGLFWYVSSPTTTATSNVYNAAGTDRLWNAVESTQTYPEITDNATALTVGKGYVARIGVTGTKTFTGGTFNTGNQSIAGLTRTGITENNRGYNLVGNPYPSTVSWDDATRTNLETTLWYRTNQGTTMLFDTYNAFGGVGTNNNGNGAVTGNIPPTQAFWVRVPTDGQTGQIDFTNADRSHGTLTSIYKVAAEEGTLRMTLSNENVSDETILLFNANALDEYGDFDSQKFWAAASVPQVYTSLDADSLVINGMSSTATNPVVDLGVKIPSQGEYTLNATSITIENTTVHLEDRMLGIFQDLNAEPIYTFTSDPGNIANRFAVHFNASITGLEEAKNSIRVYASENTINVILSESATGIIRVLDITGRVVLTQNILSDRTIIDLNNATGIYVVQVSTEKETISRKIINY